MGGTNRARAHKKAKREAQGYGDILARCGANLSKYGLQIDIDKLDQVLELALQGCSSESLRQIQILAMKNPASYRQLKGLGVPQQASPVMAPMGELPSLRIANPPQPDLEFTTDAPDGLVLGIEDNGSQEMLLGGFPSTPPAPEPAPSVANVGTLAERRGPPTMSLQDKLTARLENTEGIRAKRDQDGVIRQLKLSSDVPQAAAPAQSAEPTPEITIEEEMAIAHRLLMASRAGQAKPRIKP